jgi:ribosomal protein S18 acetylase RimI-like enzyme
MLIRNATIQDATDIHAIEILCFPPNQAASLATISTRLAVYPQHFWVLEEVGEIVGFINGMVTDNDTVKDDMFKYANLHDASAAWQSVFGLAVSPQHQNKGYAGTLIRHLMTVCKEQGRKGIILTCEKHLIPYYVKFGFVNVGLSASVHGGDVFYDMRWTT